MKTEKHTAVVETEIVTSPDGNNTYEVIKRLKDVDGEKGVMVLLYPTRTKDNIYAEDSTLNHLVGHMQELGLSELRIVNLFSKVVDGKMSASGLIVDEDNMAYIKEIMDEPGFKDARFIIAWGSSMATSFACQMSKVKILNMFVKKHPKSKAYQIMSSDIDVMTEFATHPLYLGIRGGRSLWSLAEVHITPAMLKEPVKSDKVYPFMKKKAPKIKEEGDENT